MLFSWFDWNFEKVCIATSVPIKSDLDEFTNVFPLTNPVSPTRRVMILQLYRTQQSAAFDIRMTALHRFVCMTTQHALCALNAPIASADREAERAPNSWWVLANSLSLRNAMRIQGSGVSRYAPSIDDRNILLNFNNLLKNTPASGSWNFYLIIIYHFLVRTMCIEFVFKSFTDEACTTCVGRLFHKFTIRCVKTCFLMSFLTWLVANFISFPLVRSLEENCNDGQPFLLPYLFVNSL